MNYGDLSKNTLKALCLTSKKEANSPIPEIVTNTNYEMQTLLYIRQLITEKRRLRRRYSKSRQEIDRVALNRHSRILKVTLKNFRKYQDQA